MKDNLKLTNFRKKLKAAENVLIATHLNADGDAIGSSLAMARILRKLDKNVNVVTPNDFPEFLHWVPGMEMVNVYMKKTKTVKEAAARADLILCIDFNEPDRLDSAAGPVFDSDAYKILIDHHPFPAEDKFDMLFSDTSYGSAAEYLYNLLKKAGFSRLFDREFAECIFTGIMTDTGNFSYSCSYPEVWLTVSELIGLGVDKDKIHSRIYDNYSEKRMKLMGYCLYEKMQVFPEFNTAIISLSREEMQKFDHQPGDTEGFVNLPFSIKNVKLTAMFLEKKDYVKISFRSRGDFPVNDLSSKYFRGGGHVNAAGGEWDKPLEEAVERFVKILENYRKELQ